MTRYLSRPALVFGACLAAATAVPAWAADHATHHPAPEQARPTDAGCPTGGAMEPGGMMMMRGPMMGRAMGMMGGHLEGRLAFLKTELKITPAQEGAWQRFASDWRAAIKDHPMPKRDEMMSGDLPSRLAMHQKMMAAHLEALNAIAAPLAGLYSVLSDQQKKDADELMGMMGGM
jgi:hypothetical protein